MDKVCKTGRRVSRSFSDLDLTVSKGYTKLCTYIISSFEHTVLSYTTTDSEFKDDLSRAVQLICTDYCGLLITHMNRWVP